MATTHKDVWTESRCIQLIQEFEKRPLLWDQKCHLYYKKSKKPSAWEEIGKVMNLPADKCRHKMIILMSSFRREKAKLMNTLKKRKNPFQSLWFAFKPMSFLLNRGTENKWKKSVMDITDDDDNSEMNTDDEIKSNITIEEHPLGIPMENDEPDTRRRKIPRTDNQHPTASQQNDHEIEYFSNFIASKMMKYSETTKNAVQQAICEVIFKADQNCYKQTLNEMQARSRDNQSIAISCLQPSSEVMSNANENCDEQILNVMQTSCNDTLNKPSGEVIYNADKNCYEQAPNEMQPRSSDTLNISSSAIVHRRRSSEVSIKVYYSDSD